MSVRSFFECGITSRTTIRFLLCWPGFAASFCRIPLMAQDPGLTSELENLRESVIESLEETTVGETQLEILLNLPEIKFNPNTATREELASIPCLNDFHIHCLIEYRGKYGPLLSLNELLLVPGYYKPLVDELHNYLSLNGEESNAPVPQIHRTVISMNGLSGLKSSWPVREGCTKESDSMYAFLGPATERYLNCRSNSVNGFSTAFFMQSDPGEKPGDHFSGFLSYQKPGKPLYIILGDFRAGFGSGLITGLAAPSKSAQVILNESKSDVRPYSSRAESGFCRGIAARHSGKMLNFILFASALKTDAYLTENGGFSSFNESGLHRNQTEMRKRKNLCETRVGTRVSIDKDKFSLGWNLHGMDFNRDWYPRMRPDMYSSRDTLDQIFHTSTDYRYSNSLFRIKGEFATDLNFHPATIHQLTAHLHPLLHVCLIYRYYHPSYLSRSSNSFGERTEVRNEEGWYFGLITYPFPWLEIKTYVDLFRFPWPGYYDTSPSQGNDFLVQGLFTLSRNFKLEMNFKSECKSGSYLHTTPDIKQQQEEWTKKCMIRALYDDGEGLRLKTRIEVKTFSTGGQTCIGWYTGQDAGIRLFDERLRLALRYSIFDTPDWNTRFYIWEDDLYRSYSMPLLYGRGSRSSLLSVVKLNKVIKLSFKLSDTHYTYEKTSGTGADKRTGRHFTELSLQLEWKLSAAN